MRLFKKHSCLTWDNITYRQYKLLSQIEEGLSSEDRLVEIMKIVYGEESLDWDINTFKEKAKELAFLQEQIPVQNTKRIYTVNNHKYKFQEDPQTISTAQYIDYTNFIRARNIEGAIATFLIPVDHKYGDGYDIADVIKDVMDMPVVEVTGISFFYRRYLAAYMKIFQFYLTRQIKKDKKIPKEMKMQEIMKLKAETNRILELFLTSSNSLK